jgi:hypothetical protein
MIYIDPNGNYPRHYGDIMQANPGWEVDDSLPAGWQEVAEVVFPIPTEGYNVIEGEPALVEGVLTRTYTVEPYTQEQVETKDAMSRLNDKIEAAGFTEYEMFAIRNNLV